MKQNVILADCKAEEIQSFANKCNIVSKNSFLKPVAVTIPSTLAEMYIIDSVNVIYLPKDVEKAAERISNLLNNLPELKRLGISARDSYLAHFSRESMGIQLCKSFIN